MDDQSAAENRFLTVNPTKEYSLKWTIENFDCGENVGQSLMSPVFSSESDDTTKWQIQVYPSGIDSSVRNHVSLVLWLIESRSEYVKAKFQFTLYNSERKLIVASESEIRNFVAKNRSNWRFFRFATTAPPSGKMCWGNLMFVNCDQLLTTLPGKLAKFVCKIDVLYDRKTVDTTKRLTSDHGHDHDLCHDFDRLLTSELYADCTLVASGGEVKVHKVLLAARSPVFWDMFKDDQKSTSKVDLSNVDFEVLQEMVSFIYTDKAPNLVCFADKLLQLAHFYDITKLKAECETEVIKSLKTDNVCDRLIIADQCNAEILKQGIVDFVILNVDEIMQSARWKKLPQQSYFIETLLKAFATKGH